MFFSKKPILSNGLEEQARIGGMRAAGKLTAQILDEVGERVKPGVTTEQLNDFCEGILDAAGAKSAVLGYHKFPKSICTSVNATAAHGIPNDKPLEEGDIVKIDVSLNLEGHFGDSCRTYFVGKPSAKAKEITTVAYNAMVSGINSVKPWKTVGDIGCAIENSLKNTGYTAAPTLHGHGIGSQLHMSPTIYPYGKEATGTILKPGMTITIEPVILEKGDATLTMGNKERVTKSGKLSAQFEHTVLVTEQGCEILTESPKRRFVPESIRKEVIAITNGRSPA